MDLLKYLPEPSIGNTIKCSNLQSLYFFNGFTLTDQIQCGIFLTSNDFLRPDLAQDKLSISFRPRVEVEIDQSSPFNVWRNYGGIISSTGADDLYSRVWPAFGYTGGAHEYIYECKKCGQNQGKRFNRTRREYHTGGLSDFFYGQSVRLQNLNLTPLIVKDEILLKLYPAFKGIEQNDKIGSYEGQKKIIKFQENGFTLAILGKLPSDLNISISLGVRDLSQYSVCNLWASLWIDNYASRIREVYGPTQKSWLYRWRSTRNPRQPPFTANISNIANTLLRNTLEQFIQGTLLVRSGLIPP